MMYDLPGIRARRCIEDLKLGASSPKIGYIAQALAAHVLLRLRYQVVEVNQTGHPDIIATRDDVGEVRIEVEAEAEGTHPRQLKTEDFDSLVGVPSVRGYFALAVMNPSPHWILVPAERLIERKRYSNALLRALSDKHFSNDWTYQYVRLLNDKCHLILSTSSSDLGHMALDGYGL